MQSAEQILETAAADGSIVADDWPEVLQALLSRLEHIIHHEFPIPPIVASDTPQPLTDLTASEQISSQGSHTADKENAPPAAVSSPRPPVPPFNQSSPATAGPAPIPADLLHVFNTFKTTLCNNFPKKPPHTIQRLAELALRPKAHYRFLPAYIRALDRVANVSTPTTAFPLPQASIPTGTSTILNGVLPSVVAPTFDSDESLGGALLTPIPWLRDEQNRGSEFVSESTEMVDGPHGAGRIETVTVMNGAGLSHSVSVTSSETLRDLGGVTQGELLRQEQQAGVVPKSQMTDGEADAESGDEETPHARGPEEIGMEDTGLQSRRHGTALDIEAAVGRKSSATASAATTTEDKPHPEDGQASEEDMADAPLIATTAAAAAATTSAADGAERGSKDVDKDAEADPDTVLADIDGKPTDPAA